MKTKPFAPDVSTPAHPGIALRRYYRKQLKYAHIFTWTDDALLPSLTSTKRLRPHSFLSCLYEPISHATTYTTNPAYSTRLSQGIAKGYHPQIARDLLRSTPYYHFRNLAITHFGLPPATGEQYYLTTAITRRLHANINASLAPLRRPNLTRKPHLTSPTATLDEIHCPLCPPASYITIPSQLTYKPPHESAKLSPGTYTCACGNTTVIVRLLNNHTNSYRRTSSITISQRTPTPLTFKRRRYVSLYNIPYYFKYTYYTYTPPKATQGSPKATQGPSLIVKPQPATHFARTSPSADTVHFLNHIDLHNISNNLPLLTLSSTPHLTYDPTPDTTYHFPHKYQTTKKFAKPTQRIHHRLATYYTALATRYNTYILLSDHLITPTGFPIPLTRAYSRYPSFIQAVNKLLYSPPTSHPLSHTLSSYHQKLPTALAVFKSSPFNAYTPFKNALISTIHQTLIDHLSPHLTPGEAYRLTVSPTYYHPLATLNLPLYEASLHSPTSHRDPSTSFLSPIKLANRLRSLYSITNTHHIPHELRRLKQTLFDHYRYPFDNPYAFNKHQIKTLTLYSIALRYQSRYLAHHLATTDTTHIPHLLPQLLSTLYPPSSHLSTIADALNPPHPLSPLTPTYAALLTSLNHPRSSSHIHLPISFLSS